MARQAALNVLPTGVIIIQLAHAPGQGIRPPGNENVMGMIGHERKAKALHLPKKKVSFLK
jgi:hypothetical protein